MFSKKNADPTFRQGKIASWLLVGLVTFKLLFSILLYIKTEVSERDIFFILVYLVPLMVVVNTSLKYSRNPETIINYKSFYSYT